MSLCNLNKINERARITYYYALLFYNYYNYYFFIFERGRVTSFLLLEEHLEDM